MPSPKAPVCGNSASFSYHGNEEISVACLFVVGVPVVSINTTIVQRLFLWPVSVSLEHVVDCIHRHTLALTTGQSIAYREETE